MDLVTKNDSYCMIEWGIKRYKSRVVTGNDPVWDQNAFLFIDQAHEDHFKIKISVFDHDVAIKDQR